MNNRLCCNITENVFIINDWAVNGIYKEFKRYVRYYVHKNVILCIECLWTVIVASNNETC